jgi:hypothetical protein
MERKSSLFSIVLTAVLALSVFLSACPEQKSPVTAQTQNPKKTQTPPAAKQTANVNRQEIKEESTKQTVSQPVIISRQQWKAKAAVGEVKQHTLSAITIHHTATLQKKDVDIEKKLQSLQNFSQKESRLDSGRIKPSWFDVPYHFYIAFDGKIAEGRELKFVGDTNTDYDPTGHALIVLEGNFETEQPSAEQLKSLQELAAWLSAQYKIPTSEIKAHNDYAATACPGVNLKKLLPSIRKKIDETIKAAENR